MTTQERVKALQKKADDTREEIAEALAKGRKGSYIRRLEQTLKEIEKALKALHQAIMDTLPMIIMAIYYAEIEREARRRSIDAAALAASINLADAIERMAEDSAATAADGIQDAYVRVREAVRQVRYEGVIGRWLQDGMPPNVAIERLEELLMGEGGGGIRDKRGRIIPYDVYAKMAVSTAQTMAFNMTAIGMSLSEYGDGLVKMTTHYPTCPLCAPRQGRIYRTKDFSADDERSRFPFIDQAFPGWPEYDTVHPNCKHRIVSVVWDLMSAEERTEALADAERPFDTDPRSEAEIKAYNDDQAVKRQRRQDRKQYHRIRAVLGDDAPKTFSGFRRMKRNRSENWQELMKQYRKASAE